MQVSEHNTSTKTRLDCEELYYTFFKQYIVKIVKLEFNIKKITLEKKICDMLRGHQQYLLQCK